jgi:hypothetical protein
MPRRLTWLVLLTATLAATPLYHPGSALATAPEGYKITSLAVGRFGEMDVFDSTNLVEEKHKSNVWISWQKTTGSSDLYVQSNVWLPRGSTGWHSHPGHSLIVSHPGNGDGL